MIRDLRINCEKSKLKVEVKYNEFLMVVVEVEMKSGVIEVLSLFKWEHVVSTPSPVRPYNFGSFSSLSGPHSLEVPERLDFLRRFGPELFFCGK